MKGKIFSRGFILALLLPCLVFIKSNAQKIDRVAVLKRHQVDIKKMEGLSALTVGNGNFAYTVDATGMQSFPAVYENGVPLGTQSVWGWHSFPNTENFQMAEAQKTYELEGRKIPYTVQVKSPERNKNAVEYLRVNPHRLQLGNIGLEIRKKDGSPALAADIEDIHQQLDLYSGIITSSFTVEKIPVTVVTVCHQQKDELAFSIRSVLVAEKRISVAIGFPYPTGQWKDAGTSYKSDDRHHTLLMQGRDQAVFKRQLDTSVYFVALHWSAAAEIRPSGRHHFVLQPVSGNDVFELNCGFSQSQPAFGRTSFSAVKGNSILNWNKFWQSGGAVDFSGSTNPRAFELERRVVLSQYLTKVQCSSAFPPQETGLTFNSWYGRPHLEMHWWHAVHYAQWGRPGLMEKSLDWYLTVARKARLIAKRQGFEGLRWQKMTDNNGDEAPSSVGAFLIWQQPHFIYMAELLYRSQPSAKTLKKYAAVLFATADFMSSFPTYNAVTKKYNLGKGLIPAQECFDPVSTFNPTYELAYWSWGLEVAQQWRKRLGLPRERKWDSILNNLAPLPQANGVYLAAENTPDCYDTGSKYLTDHPAVLGAYSTIPAANGLDTAVMKNTYLTVLKKWNWNETWGWDYPLLAMTAARLHLPDEALNALLMPVRTNTYLVNGHNYQDDRLTIYLPGNGGLLNAVAMMCTGTDADRKINIGFPDDGTWKVKWEGLKKMF